MHAKVAAGTSLPEGCGSWDATQHLQSWKGDVPQLHQHGKPHPKGQAPVNAHKQAPQEHHHPHQPVLLAYLQHALRNTSEKSLQSEDVS